MKFLLRAILTTLFFYGWSYGCFRFGQLHAFRYTPYSLLGFYVPTKESPTHIIRAAQAELCRHQIECKIDGEFGKQTAIGICILLDKIERGLP